MDARIILARDESLDDFTPAEVDSRKLAVFNAHAPKKSKHERDKESQLKKAKEEEEEAAKAYEEFVEAFGGDEEPQGRGGHGGGGGAGKSSRSAAKGFVRAGGGGYNPLKDREQVQPQPAAPPTGPSSTGARGSRPSAMSLLDDDDELDVVVPKLPPGKKPRDMDKFLEELKRDQKEREDRLQYQAGRAGSSVTALAAREQAPILSGSYDNGDPQTTNVHVSNLPQNVTEQSLGMLFARYGPVGSVKIMWPRMEGPPIPAGRRILAGFVAYLRRSDAVAAAKDLDGFEWGGQVLRTGWGKSVPLPTRPIYEIESASSSSRRRTRDSSPGSPVAKRRRSSFSPPREIVKRNWPTLEQGVEDRFLRTVAGKVREHGANFESVIREREKGNSKFAFFRDDSLPSFHFFKMLLDASYVPPSEPTFFDEGNADAYSSDSAEESENEHVRKGSIGRRAERRFESMLRGLVSTRERIARAMAFALEHADAADAIVDILVGSLTLDATPVPRKIARLHLVSDILHNATSLPHAWVYRAQFERRLTRVFDHLGDVYLSFPGRMKAEQFKIQVTNIVDVWERDWFVFEPAVIDDFKRRLSGETVVVHTDPTPSSSSSSPPIHLAQPHAASSSSALPPPPSSDTAFRSTGFKAVTFATSSFQPSTLHAILPDEDPEGDLLDGEMVDVDGEDVDGADVDVDGDEVQGLERVIPETVVLDDDDEDEDGMDLAQSDEDMF
ncbi:hypothetical protein RQP46_011363 [Phenoliferia psychrophenolica]